MNRLAVCRVSAAGAATIAVFDLVSAWTIQMSAPAFVVSVGLFGVAVVLYGWLLVIGVRERRRIIARAASSADVVNRAASRIRLSALASIALTVLLFANCSASASSGAPVYSGPMNDVPGFLRGSAEVLLPILLVIALAAALASAAEVYVTRRQWRSAQRAAQAAIWSVVAIAIVAVVTVPLGFVFLASQCFFATSPGACAAGAASFTNVFLAGTFALLLPYVLMVTRAFGSASTTGLSAGDKN